MKQVVFIFLRNVGIMQQNMALYLFINRSLRAETVEEEAADLLQDVEYVSHVVARLAEVHG
jgi:hypothetical protein